MSIKMQTHENRERGGSLQCDRSHINVLIEHLVVKLLRKITRFLVSFIKIPVLLEPCSKNGVLCR